MTQVDTFGAYVRARLEHWGREFALHRDCEYLGHRSKDTLQILIEHRGEMPPRATGYKPLEVDDEALQIEQLVSIIGRESPLRATVLRAYYCGTGRRGVERLETANRMLARMGFSPLSKPKFFATHEVAFAEVRGILTGLSAAA